MSAARKGAAAGAGKAVRMGRSQAEHMAEQLAAALGRAVAAERERDAARGVLADVLAERGAGDLWSAQVSDDLHEDSEPSEILLRAKTREDALALIRNDHVAVVADGFATIQFKVRLWRVKDGAGVLTCDPHSDHTIDWTEQCSDCGMSETDHDDDRVAPEAREQTCGRFWQDGGRVAVSIDGGALTDPDGTPLPPGDVHFAEVTRG